MKTLTTFFAALLLLVSCSNIKNKDASKDKRLTYEEMVAGKKDALRSFNDEKFGMFIHWGLYSIPGGIWKGKKMEEMNGIISEWIQDKAEIPRDEYALLAKQFNPTAFDAKAIAALAKNAGMKYIVITAKHHDGFAMYDSQVSEYDIVDASPYGKDIIAALYNACKEEDLGFGLYYSQNLDWMDGGDCGLSEYLAQGLPENEHTQRKQGVNTYDPSPNTFTQYLENKSFPQVKELLTKFPDLHSLWYDTPWYINAEQSMQFYRLATELQPNILVNSRVGAELGDFIVGGDNHIPEEIPGYSRPWQGIGTTNNSWGFKSYDKDWKTPKELLYWLLEIVSKGGNYMLNIGPDALGRVPEESSQNLLTIGKWLKVNSEAIYKTTKWKVAHEGPTKIIVKSTRDRAKGKKFEFTAEDFWFTQNDNNVFVISLKYPEDQIVVKSLSSDKVEEISEVVILGTDGELTWSQTKEGLVVNLKGIQVDELGYSLKVTFNK